MIGNTDLSRAFDYIAELINKYRLKIDEVERLIEAVSAYDPEDVSGFCRVSVEIAEGMEEDGRELRPHEVVWKGTEKAWRERRIFLDTAKQIAAAVAVDDNRIKHLLNTRDTILRQKLPGDDIEENHEIRMREIAAPGHSPSAS